MRQLSPSTLTILTTSRCTAACRHCNMNAGPDRRDMLTWESLDPMLDQVIALQPQVLVFAGGEPTLLGETLLRAIRKCTAAGLPTRMVTNAYWATSLESARNMLRPFREAGLYDLNISTDDFHLPWISLQRVRWAYDAAIELGFPSVVVATCHGPGSALRPDQLNESMAAGQMAVRFDDEGGSTLETLSPADITSGILSNSRTQRIGRGAHALWDDEVFPTEPWLEDAVAYGCPAAVSSAAISPRGHFLACCGFELEDNPILDYGDLHEEPLSALIDRADQDVLTNAIAFLGPHTMKRLLESACPDEVSFDRPNYRTLCEVCQDIVKHEGNRAAALRHQGLFVRAILEARAE